MEKTNYQKVILVEGVNTYEFFGCDLQYFVSDGGIIEICAENTPSNMLSVIETGRTFTVITLGKIHFSVPAHMLYAAVAFEDSENE